MKTCPKCGLGLEDVTIKCIGCGHDTTKPFENTNKSSKPKGSSLFLVVILLIAISAPFTMPKIMPYLTGESTTKAADSSETSRAAEERNHESLLDNEVEPDRKAPVKVHRKSKNEETGKTAAEYYRQGLAYYYGRGVEKNYRQASKFLREAAEKGHPEAMYNLGIMYGKGEGVKRDYRQRDMWHRKAAEKGHPEAMYNLAVKYHSGRGVKKDYRKVLTLYRKAADKGVAEAMYNLGDMYERGEGVKRDHRQAAMWYRKAANKGVPEAMVNLGVLYEKGLGVEKDYRQAVKWCRKAADKGIPLAMSNLGGMYEKGLGVEKDYRQAAQWYRKAADKGDSVAMNSLGHLYNDGKGVERDHRQAIYWIRKAVDKGNSVAMSDLGVMYHMGHGVEKDYRQAVEWYRKAADKGNPVAMNNLGVMYYKGYGVERDNQQAIYWTRKAAYSGVEDAKVFLKQLEKETKPPAWRSHKLLKNRFNPKFPDELQVIIYDGGPRITNTGVEVVWARIIAYNGELYTAIVNNTPKNLKLVKREDKIKFMIKEGWEYPVEVKGKYLQEKSEWTIRRCDKCGFSELFDAPSDLVEVLFRDVPEDTTIRFFTSRCPLCGGIQVVRHKHHGIKPK